MCVYSLMGSLMFTCYECVYQHEVTRNRELCVLVRRLEEREVETGRSLTEQAESNRQLQMKIDELQKHLEEKDNSLTQANQVCVYVFVCVCVCECL